MFGHTQTARAGLVLVLCGTIGATAAAQAPPHVPGRLLVKFREDVTPEQVRGLLTAAGAKVQKTIPRIGVHVLQLPANATEVATRSAFTKRAEVQFAELDYIRAPQQSSTLPNDPYYANWEWHLRKIQCPTAWPVSTGSNVVIAILDSGVDASHPDLSSKVVAGWNVYDNNSNTTDVYGHGTIVAGVAAAATNNGIGVASVSWNSKIMPIRITDTSGYTVDSLVASGITWAADHGARVANVSFQVSNNPAVSAAAGYMLSKGGVVTVSAGNSGGFDSRTDDPNVLTVTSTDSNDMIASYAMTGNNLDVTAPHTAWTTVRGGAYNSYSGTSVSAPMVAGVAALVIAANPNLTGQQVQDIIKQTADDKGAAGWDSTYGWGRVNAARAVSATGGSQVNNVPTIASPATASANPVTGKTVGLSVLGADDGGEAALLYTWTSTGPASVSFSANGSNSAKNLMATFGQAGAYTFTVSVTDTGGLSKTSSVGVTVSQTPTSLVTSPSAASVNTAQSQQFGSSVRDQFGIALATQPACSWSVSGGGTISSTGLFKAGSTPGGPFTVTAAATISGTSTVSVVSADATAPTVSIMSPTGGVVSGTFAVSASATDNIGVVRVELWVDGKLHSTDTAALWSFSVNTKPWKRGSSHTLACKAFDAAGNCGTSAPVTVKK